MKPDEERMMEHGAIAIIPARGGSKRVPRKNIRNFHGKPVIAWPLAAAMESGLFHTVMVSTDDQEIADIAGHLGASVPFLRSSATASDHASTVDVLIEVLAEYEKRDIAFSHVCCIYPAAPFITSAWLRDAYGTLMATGAESVIPVVRYGHPIQRAMKVVHGKISYFHPENMHVRTQDLEPAYHDAGQFYWIATQPLLKAQCLVTGNSAPFVLSEGDVQDIDTPEDWDIAELKFSMRRQ